MPIKTITVTYSDNTTETFIQQTMPVAPIQQIQVPLNTPIEIIAAQPSA